MDLDAAETAVRIAVTAADGSTRTCAVAVARGDGGGHGGDGGGGRHGVLSAAGGDRPAGLRSDGTTLWVLDDVDAVGYAFGAADGARQAARDIELVLGADDGAFHYPWGAWSDGEVLLTSDHWGGRVRAFRLQGRRASRAPELAGLRRLSLRDNGIGSIEGLSGLAVLEHLDVGGNDIADLRPLAGLKRLRELRADGNAVVDAAPLLALEALEVVDLRGNPVADADALERLPRLRRLERDAAAARTRGER